MTMEQIKTGVSRKWLGWMDGIIGKVPGRRFVLLFTLSVLGVVGCGGGGGSSSGGTTQVSAPVIKSAAAMNGASLVSMTDSTPGATIFYTVDGSAPSSASPQYLAPFLVTTNETVQAVAVLSGGTNSTVTSEPFTTAVPSGTLVWEDDFGNSTTSNVQPNPNIWTYDTGAGGWGNDELEDYCGWGSTASPCSTSSPNVYIGTDGYLHITAEQPSTGVYTSARLKTEGLFSFQYGRLEFKAEVPEGQGLWPAAWLMGNNESTTGWPACGEQDVLEREGPAETPDFNVGSIHGPGFTGTNLGTTYFFPTGETASTWHTYGMIWKPGSISYYVDSPSNVYATYTPSSLSGLAGASWPFDGGQSNFLILNLAVGGNYPGSPNATTVFPAEMVVQYVRLYTN
ncbi:MAG: FN3 associated domain-containing protein [Acidobacteriaceae bacterium]